MASSPTKSTDAIQRSLWQPRWRSLPGREAAGDPALVDACVELYSNHYGRWGAPSPKSGQPVRLTREQLLERLDDDAVWLACAFHDERLIGYCIAVWTTVPKKGRIAWVSQLVVAETYRNARVATRLLYSVWQFSDCYAWGLATANPFAVRALETATRRPCRRALIAKHGGDVLHHLAEHIPYLPPRLVTDARGRPQPRVDTRFLLDHTGVPEMRELARRGDRPWALGSLSCGEEWFACTFSAQVPQEVDDARLAELLTGADSIWLQAYEAMTMDEKHAWHRHAEDEVDMIITSLGIPPDASVLDVGCGDGRHVRVFADRGHEIIGVDLSARLVERARENAVGAHVDVLDARAELPAGPFDLIVSLYDVIGSSASPEDDRRLMANVVSSLSAGGYFVASVMNAGATAGRIEDTHLPDGNADFITALEDLSPSNTMEQTGAVFDPDLLLYYNGVYYRKEQFQATKWQLPAELVVRDRRFSSSSLRALAESVGLEIVEIRPVQAGGWRRRPALNEHDNAAKELLLIARKPQPS